MKSLQDPDISLPQNRLTSEQRNLLLIAAAVSSGCGLAAELLLGTLASYLVGNQALAYGVAVGGFLAAMGIGAYLSRFIQGNLLINFIKIELSIAPLTALLPLGLFGLFVVDSSLWIGLVLVTILLGTLAGLEVPILTRLIEEYEGVKEALAGVLALDYLGALLGSLLFPVILLPAFGLFPSAVIIGSSPAFMVFLLGRVFPELKIWKLWGLLIGIILLLLTPLISPISNALENSLYKGPIITRIQSPYQRIILTRQGQDLRLFLDGDLQLSSLDEYRYHEALVHPAMSVNSQRHQVLILGAGDGMALREVLKWPEVQRVVLIDLDQAVVNLAKHHPFLSQVNQQSFLDSRVEVIYGDAFVEVGKLTNTFDVVIADFPDPDREIIAKLYAKGFYERLLSRLAVDGVLITQASSSFFAPKVMSCIAATLQSVGLKVYPYTIDVPSFGPWGFVMAIRENSRAENRISQQNLMLPIATRFLTEAILQNLFNLPKDMQLQRVKINRLSDPVIVRYQSDWRWIAYD